MKRFEQVLILALCTEMVISGLAWQRKADALQREIAELEERQRKLESSLQEAKPTMSAAVLEVLPDETAVEPRYNLSDADRELIERVVMAESGNQPLEGQIAVASCIYNTAAAKGMKPAEVVQVKGQYASPYAGEATDSVKQAVSVVFDEDKPVEDVRYFYSTAGGFVSTWHESALVYVDTIGQHRFFREGERMKLEEVETCELVAELQKREGVEKYTAEPYQDVTVSVNGPAVVLVVID